MRTENTCASQPLSGITTISAIKYEVEIQPPSSIPAPIAPWMSASEALTIWILSTAMKAPRVAPNTAIQVFAGTAGAVCAARSAAARLAKVAEALMVGWSVLMEISSCLQRQDALGVGFDNQRKSGRIIRLRLIMMLSRSEGLTPVR